ncbi:MAG: hypothetical protein RLZZ292_3843, partial [Bacteroidota bacterium]
EGFLPFYTKGKKLEVTDVVVATDLEGAYLLNEDALNPSVAAGTLKTYALTEQSLKIENWKLTLPDAITSDAKNWMVLRFIIKK